MRQFISAVDCAEFDSFALKAKTNHYTKTSAFGQFKAADGYDYFLTGVKDDGKLVATALVLRKKIPYLGSYYCYVTYGYNMAYEDRELLRFFNKQLTDFVKKELRACFLRIDPNVCRREHLKDGKLKEDGFNNEWLTVALEEDGFRHLGYNYGYSGNWMSRFTYLLDISDDLETIKKRIKNFKNHTRKNEMRCLTVHEGQRSDLMVLYEAQLELARKDRFVPKPLSYFESLFDSFGSGAHLYLAKTNLQQAYQNVKAEKKNLEKQLLSALNEHKKNELESSIEALSREISSMEELGYDQQGEKYLGAKLILQLNDKVFNVNMYTTKILPNFRTALALHTKALEDSKIREAKTYDFEGVSGSLDPHDAYYGIYDFKRSFGGDFLEFIGEFDYVFDQQKYQAFRKYDRLYRRFRRKVYLTVKGW